MPSHPVLPQLSRFGAVGVLASVINLAIYQAGVIAGGYNPNLAWTAGFLVATATAFALHDRWSFRDTRRDGAPRTRASARFAVVSLASFALNSLWVWLLVQHFHLPVWSPYPLVLGATPLLAFWINRIWVFR